MAVVYGVVGVEVLIVVVGVAVGDAVAVDVVAGSFHAWHKVLHIRRNISHSW